MPLQKSELIIHCFAGSTGVSQAGLAAALAEAFPIPVTHGPQLPIPDQGLDRQRQQYRSSAFLDALSLSRERAGEAAGPSSAVLLGLTGADLFAPRLNFVFGEADRVRSVAVVSTHRLFPEFYGEDPDTALFETRLMKEAIHELGHVFGLPHCGDPGCIMHFSRVIAETDLKGPGFCRWCQKRLAGGGGTEIG